MMRGTKTTLNTFTSGRRGLSGDCGKNSWGGHLLEGAAASLAEFKTEFSLRSRAHLPAAPGIGVYSASFKNQYIISVIKLRP
jgi:hypothetical protein